MEEKKKRETVKEDGEGEWRGGKRRGMGRERRGKGIAAEREYRTGMRRQAARKMMPMVLSCTVLMEGWRGSTGEWGALSPHLSLKIPLSSRFS